MGCQCWRNYSELHAGEHSANERATTATFDKDPVASLEPLTLVAAMLVACEVRQFFLGKNFSFHDYVSMLSSRAAEVWFRKIRFEVSATCNDIDAVVLAPKDVGGACFALL